MPCSPSEPVAESKAFFGSAPHLLIYPGMAIVLTVLGFLLVGDGLRAQGIGATHEQNGANAIHGIPLSPPCENDRASGVPKS